MGGLQHHPMTWLCKKNEGKTDFTTWLNNPYIRGVYGCGPYPLLLYLYRMWGMWGWQHATQEVLMWDIAGWTGIYYIHKLYVFLKQWWLGHHQMVSLILMGFFMWEQLANRSSNSSNFMDFDGFWPCHQFTPRWFKRFQNRVYKMVPPVMFVGS